MYCSKNFLSVLFYPVAKPKPILNPAYCLDRDLMFLPGLLNVSGEKHDYMTAVTFFKKINLFIFNFYIWLRWVLCGLLIEVASLVAEHGL